MRHSDSRSPTIKGVSSLGSTSNTLADLRHGAWRDRGVARCDRAVLGETFTDMNRRVRPQWSPWCSPSAGAFPAVASAHAVLERTTPVASATVPASPASGHADLRRGGGAAVRGDFGHRRRRPPAGGGYAVRGPRRPRHARHQREASAPGLVPGLLAGDLGRRPPGAGSVHVRGWPKPRRRSPVRDSLAERDRRRPPSWCSCAGWCFSRS